MNHSSMMDYTDANDGINELQGEKSIVNHPNNINEDHLRLLNCIVSDIISSLTVEDIVMSVHHNLCNLMNGIMIALGVYNHKENALDFYGVGGCKETMGYGKVSLDESDVWTVKCFTEGKEIVFNTTPQGMSYRFSGILFNSNQPRNSFVYIPLKFKERILGVLTVQSDRSNAFKPQDIEILRSMGYYLAIALENSNSYRRIERQNEEILRKNASLLLYQEHLEELVAARTDEINKQKEELIAQSRQLELLSIVARETENAIMIMDPNGNILWINDFFTRIYGYNYKEFIKARGSNIRETSFNPSISETLERCVKTCNPIYYEAPNISKQGVTKWTHTTLTPILNSEGILTHLVTIDSDITDRKGKEQKILKYTHELTESIQYAWRIQNAILPPAESLKELIPEYFVLFRPKGIVSGDFYWAAKAQGRTIIAAADCTGHGIPGAFMSILGVSLLNEIVSKHDVSDAAGILNQLRTNLKSTLHQNGAKGQTRDGMDISLCVIEPDRKVMHFAGAYQPIIIANPNGVRIIRGDRMPIGVYPKEKESFTNHMVKCEPNSTYYILSDGFTSMFGGPRMKKYRMDQLLSLVLQVNNLPVAEQKQVFLNEMDSWLGTNEHLDDTLLVGFRV